MNIGYRDFRGGFENYIHAYIKKYKKVRTKGTDLEKFFGTYKNIRQFVRHILETKTKKVFIFLFTNRIQNFGGGNILLPTLKKKSES